jgi:hypothetical protein
MKLKNTIPKDPKEIHPLSIVKTGDLIHVDPFSVTSLVISIFTNPIKYIKNGFRLSSHTAIIKKDMYGHWVCEANKDKGFHKVHLWDWASRRSNQKFRVSYIAATGKRRRIGQAIDKYIGKKYERLVMMILIPSKSKKDDNSRVFCSEVSARCLIEGGIHIPRNPDLIHPDWLDTYAKKHLEETKKERINSIYG